MTRVSRTPDRWTRVLRRGVIIVAAIELVYLLAANTLLNMAWLVDAVNGRPERVQVTWQSVRTVFPGYFSGTGLRLRTQSARVQSLTEAASFSGWISPLALLRRSLHIRGAVLDDPVVTVRSARMLRRARSEERVFFPEIPGLAPLTAEMPALQGPFKPGWWIEATGITLRGEHRYRIGNYAVEASGEVAGDVSYRVRDAITVHDARGRLDSIRARLNEEDLVNDASIEGSFASAPFVPYFTPGLKKLDAISTDVTVSGTLSSLEVLNFYLGVERRRDWPGLSAAGDVSGRLVVEQGRLRPATDLKVDAEEISFRTDKFAVSSAGQIRLQPAAGADNSLMQFELGTIAVRHRKQDRNLVETRDLVFYINAADASLGSPLTDADVRMRIRDSAVPDLAVFNDFIPSKIPLAFTGGVGRIRGELAWRDGLVSGDVLLAAKEVSLALKGHDIVASFEMMLKLDAEPDTRLLSVGGTELAIFDARLARAGADLAPWSGKIVFDTARVQFDEGLRESIRPGQVMSALVDFADGEVVLRGDVSNLDFLGHVLSRERRLSFDGAGALSANLTMSSGTIAAGSKARFSAERLDARFLDFVARGRGQLDAAFRGEEGGRRLDVDARLANVALVREGEDTAFVEAPAAHFHVRGHSPDITEPLQNVIIDFRIDPARVPDITVYNAYLPDKDVLRLTHGAGEIRTRFTLEQERATARVRLDAPGIGAMINQRALTLDLDMDIALNNGDMDSRRFDVAGSQLTFSNLDYGGEDEGPWSSTLTFRDGSLRWTAPVGLDAGAELSMTSSRPLVELLAGSFDQLRWARNLLSVNNVTGTSRIIIDGDALVFNDLDIRGEEIQIAAKLRIDDAGPKGIVFNRYGPLKAAVSFDGEERDWHLISARKQFDNHPGY